MEPLNDQALCSTCAQTAAWHREHKPRHEFTNPGEASRVHEPDPLPVPRTGDPILRLALIKAGVLSEIEMGEAQLWMNQAVQQGKAVIVDEGTYKLVDFAEEIQRILAARQ